MYWDDRSTLDPQWYVNDSLSEGACVLYGVFVVRFENHFIIVSSYISYYLCNVIQYFKIVVSSFIFLAKV